eukprot:CAMPEP_0170621860 /NCGR_PEP_ID=MMETSP0224-20130122/28822_1 /TAXON_ID=285029 /ORGANISM="Togula jolla, Strain CCCM 725" /LENGTH=498 /DNA_ID=CAMNT_0010948139 /DNA_START=66 /DNA_END=1562 /DNA_ORIENTATION=+
MAFFMPSSTAGFSACSCRIEAETFDQICLVALGIGSMVVVYVAILLSEPDLTLGVVLATLYALRERESKRMTSRKASSVPQAVSQNQPSPVQQPQTGRSARQKKARISCFQSVRLTALKKELQPSPIPESMPLAVHVAKTKCRAADWHAEARELLEHTARKPVLDARMAIIVAKVKAACRVIFPEADVIGYVTGNPARGLVRRAVPDFNIVMWVDPIVLACRLERALKRNPWIKSEHYGRRVTKCVMQLCIQQLVSAEGFGLRRTAFSVDESKVNFVVPTSEGSCHNPLPFHFFVNSTMPEKLWTFMDRCSKLDSRAEPLILFAQQWARDRGIAHASQGHLSLYAWSILVVFFLQVEDRANSNFAPMQPGGGATPVQESPQVLSESVAALFKVFVHFYARHFDFEHEGISVHKGCRAPPQAALPLHYTMHNGVRVVGPHIQDPLEVTKNLASDITGLGMARLRQEFIRADALCSQEASLAEVLEQWVPIGMSPCEADE